MSDMKYIDDKEKQFYWENQQLTIFDFTGNRISASK